MRCNVLPSMKKCDPHRTMACLRPDGMVKAAICTCTAGLAGCCNHVAALLYALEEFVRFGLKSEDLMSPISRLCQWNRPRSRKVVPQRVADIQLRKASFGTKHPSLRRAENNVIPPNKRILDPAEVKKFASDLEAAHSVRSAPSAPSVDGTGHDLSLKRQHAYFYQIQLQLYVTECTWCDLVVWTPEDVFVQRIAKEEGFVEGHLPKLKKFYFDHLLPAVLQSHCELTITCRAILPIGLWCL